MKVQSEREKAEQEERTVLPFLEYEVEGEHRAQPKDLTERLLIYMASSFSSGGHGVSLCYHLLQHIDSSGVGKPLNHSIEKNSQMCFTHSTLYNRGQSTQCVLSRARRIGTQQTFSSTTSRTV